MNPELAKRIKPFFDRQNIKTDLPTLVKIAPIIRERLTTLDDAIDMAGFFFREFPIISSDQLLGKDMSKVNSLRLSLKELF